MKCPDCGTEDIYPIIDTAAICLNPYCSTYLFKPENQASHISGVGPKSKEDSTDGK